ncbi:MAG: bifunctional phosphopantothenoylcysteine decarboxylase/phosphopantothenate--cysteine ligase CoaBC [Bacteroidetes bacterium]|nr:bifunctional phosphopantothenoylcysteine decarboxylase/phosphopantothenate--cysteine ligase CoaBC [Bacteroidota bacterium]
MSLAGKQVLLGVCGSIAAYKSVFLLRLLQQAGARVQVALTPNVSRFVGELTFASLSQQPVFADLWSTEQSWSQHVHRARAADIDIRAPATAHTLAKLAHGLCDNAVTALTLSAQCPVLVCPAMDHEMVRHPATQGNLNRLQKLGYQVLAPETGYLASGATGEGRMAEPEQILARAKAILNRLPQPQQQPLAGRRLLVTAGPTREPIDPVRYLTNHSTGKMGVALASTARALGAEVTLVHGPLQVPVPAEVASVPVVTAQEMLAAVQQQYAHQDILIFAAAVSDYTPAQTATHKLKKQGAELNLPLKPTEDILAWVGRHRNSRQVLVGFALETRDAEEYARQKLTRKQLDCIVVNSLADEGAGFGHDTNRISILDQNGQAARYPLKSKTEAALDILMYIVQHHLPPKE